jgi:hypothetical protein
MTRQSYLPSEIHWGCTFVNIIQQAAAGQMQHSINLSRWVAPKTNDVMGSCCSTAASLMVS